MVSEIPVSLRMLSNTIIIVLAVFGFVVLPLYLGWREGWEGWKPEYYVPLGIISTFTLVLVAIVMGWV